MSGLRGVILAGGQGSRMGVLGTQYPKAMLPIANEPIIVHHLRLLQQLGAAVVDIVVGHHAEAFEAALGDGQAYGLRLRYVDQGPRLGSAYALGRLRGRIEDPFLLVLGDYYFVATEAERMVRRLRDGASAIAVKYEDDVQAIRNACVVTLGPSHRVAGIIEKPSTPKTRSKGCGFYALQPDFFDAVARTPRTALRDEYELTVALEQYLSVGGELYGEEIIVRDANLTCPRDVLACNLEWLEHSGLPVLVHSSATVDPRTQLSQVLVGPGASVRGESRLERVVVFPGARCDGAGSMCSALVTEYGSIDCAAGAPVPVMFSSSHHLQVQESLP
jgi:glucose-1-phosphate thymidylyltransferase